MKNLVTIGSSRINKDFLGVRPPALVRVPRVETAYPIHRSLACSELAIQGSPLRAVSF